jgi:hypothetical protein
MSEALIISTLYCLKEIRGFVNTNKLTQQKQGIIVATALCFS